jgi:hypothetical protein
MGEENSNEGRMEARYPLMWQRDISLIGEKQAIADGCKQRGPLLLKLQGVLLF